MKLKRKLLFLLFLGKKNQISGKISYTSYLEEKAILNSFVNYGRDN